MKTAWAKKILKAKKWPVYTAIRARIWLRKVKIELTDKNIEAEVARIKHKGNKAGFLSIEDVMTALEHGEEVYMAISPFLHNIDALSVVEHRCN